MLTAFRGGRFNVSPEGYVRTSLGSVLRSNQFEDPQVAFDEATRIHDDRDNHQDAIDLLGIGPRRNTEELGDHVVIKLGNGKRLII